MEYGARPSFGGVIAPMPDPTQRLAWFERGSAEQHPVSDAAAEEGGLLDRFREADGLVYSGESDSEF